MNKFAFSAAAMGAAIVAGGTAQATTVASPDNSVTLSNKDSFGSQNGVHFDAYTGSAVTGYVNQDNSSASFTSSGLTGATIGSGGGEATLYGTLADLTITFSKAWDAITFSLTSDIISHMTLTVNGDTSYTFGGADCGVVCDLGKNGQNKFVVTGSNITSLAFTFDPSLDSSTLKQVRMQDFAVSATGVLTSAVPEPATWAMMLMGFGLVGAGLRGRRGAPARVLA